MLNKSVDHFDSEDKKKLKGSCNYNDFMIVISVDAVIFKLNFVGLETPKIMTP